MSQKMTVPLICGGVYERHDPHTGLPERVMVYATKRMVGGRLVGLALQAQQAYALEFIKGDEIMAGWALVAKPEELAERISAGNIVETQNASLKRQLSVATNRVAELERAVKKSELTDDVLVKRLDDLGSFNRAELGSGRLLERPGDRGREVAQLPLPSRAG